MRSTLKEDLYLTLMAFDEAEGSHATVRAIVNPAVQGRADMGAVGARVKAKLGQ